MDYLDILAEKAFNYLLVKNKFFQNNEFYDCPENRTSVNEIIVGKIGVIINY